jgi:hypothetical protein
LPAIPQEHQLINILRTRLESARAKGALEALGPHIAATLYLNPARLPPIDISPLPAAAAALLMS